MLDTGLAETVPQTSGAQYQYLFATRPSAIAGAAVAACMVLGASETALSTTSGASETMATGSLISGGMPIESALFRHLDNDWLRWRMYLSALEQVAEVSPAQLDKIKRLWSEVHQRSMGQAPPPSAGPLDGNVFHMAWSVGVHYCEVDVSQDGSLEWFYKNRETLELDGEDGCADVPHRLVERLYRLRRIG